MQIMQLITTPEHSDFRSSEDLALKNRRILEWHEYIREKSGSIVTHSWGSHQILNHRFPSNVKEAFVNVVTCENLDEFDHYMVNDPIRDICSYMTVLLTNLENDWADDEKRLEDAKRDLFDAKDREPAWYVEERQHFKKRPDYVGQYEFIVPKNSPVNYAGGRDELDKLYSARPLEILIYGMNPPELMTWSDSRKLIHYEKVIWWHHHVAQMINEEHVSHVWGTHDFCQLNSDSANSASAATIYRSQDLDEFDQIYRLDPLRAHGNFISVILKSIEKQYEYDKARYDLMS